MEFVCKACGKRFSDNKHKERVYCSRQCCASVTIIPYWKSGLHKRGPMSEEHKRKVSLGRTGVAVGEQHPNWRGGRMVDRSTGYASVLAPWHPHRRPNNYVLEHRLVMEKRLGRLLERGERVHHINGNRVDNRIENLKLFSSQSEHIKAHHVSKGTKNFHS